MKEYFGIAITDGRNRNNQELTFDAMCNAYYKTWNKPLPMHIGHDRTKPIGYTYLNGIYMEPGKAYATNTARLIETEEEQKKLIKIIDNISYVEHCNHHKEEIEILLKKLNCHVIGKYSVIPTYQAVAINNENIVSRVFPEMVSHINDGLIDLREIEPVYSVNSSGEKGTLIPGVYKKDSYLLFAHRFFRRNLSILNTTNDLFFSLFEKMRSNSELKLQISLDMDMIGLLGTEKTELEYQYQRGPYFNNDLEKIPLGVTCLTNEKYDNLFSN